MSSFRQIFQTLKPRMQLQYYQWLPGFGVGFGFAGGFTGLHLFLEDKVHPALWGGFPILGGVFVGICVSPMYPAIVPFSMYHFLKACYNEYLHVTEPIQDARAQFLEDERLNAKADKDSERSGEAACGKWKRN